MIRKLLALLALATVAIAQDCGGDPSLGCMDDTECTVGTCVRAAPADFLGCCSAPTTTTAPAASTTTVATSTSSCVDLLNPQTGVSDCPARAYLCNDAVNATSMPSHVQLLHIYWNLYWHRVYFAYCTNAVYTSLMRTQCPATCGFCTGSGTSSVVTGGTSGGTSSGSTTSCVDLKNPNTGVSDCPNMRGYCTNAVYTSLMRTQCPATCGFCTSG
ncbi:hypothetical protein PRIPAC_92447 [Pristionchus pacificus]|uniref:ShK domain-containing protein n=1 Tax=Pristionchus pacificus TaxID=54126 RepID=A0A2A6CDP7_PRIPA|nr:hypothetical protein PRIPAC_92447 [Pristionchus pacificus]|eukprot:PDM76365.1 ShK domain-containing protein [Pristionchus pacificus]